MSRDQDENLQEPPLPREATPASLEGSLLDVFKVESLEEIGELGLEVGIDAALDQGLLRDVPVVGSLIAVLKGARDIRDRLFLRKIVQFILPLSTVTQEKRRRFAEDLAKRRKQDELAEVMLNLVDKVDSSSKAGLLGKILRAAVLREFGFEMMMRLSAMVERAYGPDLPELRRAETDLGIAPVIAESLAAVGFLDRRNEVSLIPRGPGHDNIEVFFALNEYGRTLVRLMHD